MPPRRLLAAAIVALMLAACTGDEGPGSTVQRSPGQDTVSLRAMQEHLEAFQVSADASGGTRAAGTPGHEASVDYVIATMEKAGYEVNTQTFTFDYFGQEGTARIELDGGRWDYQDGRDFRPMLYSASGRLTASVVAVEFDVRAQSHDGPGCEPAAFDLFPAGAVALLRPGPCFYREQVVNAQDAGASAVIFAFPEYSRAGGVLRPTLITPSVITVPVLAASDQLGVDLANAPSPRVSIDVDTVVEERITRNVIAESPRGDGEHVVMVGGHLDSVIDGPGINDNGSGIATILAIAQELTDDELRNRLRFAFWSGEELGLLGSTHYVEELSDAEIGRIDSYLNFDMVGSPNGVAQIYAPDGHEESKAIYDLFAASFEAAGLPFINTDIQGRSDHAAFQRVGIATGGIFTGAEEIKSVRQARRFGGTASVPLDPCYHEACDDIGNVAQRYMDQMAEAIMEVVSELALTDG